jgi:hypothetical protein
MRRHVLYTNAFKVTERKKERKKERKRREKKKKRYGTSRRIGLGICMRRRSKYLNSSTKG